MNVTTEHVTRGVTAPRDAKHLELRVGTPCVADNVNLRGSRSRLSSLVFWSRGGNNGRRVLLLCSLCRIIRGLSRKTVTGKGSVN